MEDFLYCKDLYKPIQLKQNHITHLMMTGMWNIEKSIFILEGGWIQLYINTFMMKRKQMLFRKSLKTFFPENIRK